MNARLERVAQLIRDEVAGILRRDIHDPLIGFVTITDAEVSPDLRFAKVFFSVLGDPQQVKDSIKGLLRARKHINALLADRLDLRYIPKLRFVYDETAAKAQRMAELLREEHEALAADLARHEAEQAPDAESSAVSPEADDAPPAEDDEDFDEQFEDDDVEEEDFAENEDEEEGN